MATITKTIINYSCLVISLVACNNSPYPNDELAANTYYTSFSTRPKHFDPARSYSSNESLIIGQIYEPPLQYHYIKRPYTLEPLTASLLPQVKYLDANNQEITDPDDKIVTSVYTIKIKPNIYYQPHPAFSERDTNYQLTPITTDQPDELFINTPNINQRELVAADFVYQIKRLADPQLHSPIYGFMSKYIQGLAKLRQTINSAIKSKNSKWLDLRSIDFKGAKAIDKYSYQIRINGKYPQFNLWLAMNFFAPIPWEADEFYQQPELIKRNINLDWYPIGTGAYMLTVNNPNHKILLTKNPNFHTDYYPANTPQHSSSDAGKQLPFINKILFSLEKESIPLWNKFLQGFYDASGISSENFDYSIASSGNQLTDKMRAKGIYLKTSISPSVYYLGFNMLDQIVGGSGEKTRKLRQAISMAYDYENYISIFLNGRGIAAQSPIPPGIFGFAQGKAGLNTVVYKWQNNKSVRRSIDKAKQLLAEAGYPNGIDPKTGKSLKLYLDGISTGAGSIANTDWQKKQFAKLNIQLIVRNTDYNRFQDKMRKGKAQLFGWGWAADYPDPENFLFLLYGKNSKVSHNGENAANYTSQQFDNKFELMQVMENSPERLKIIQQMIKIAQTDSPWIWGFHPKGYGLYHAWVKNKVPNSMANNTLKYLRIDNKLRAKQRQLWNQPVLLPLFIIIILVLVFLGLIYRAYQRSLKLSLIQKTLNQK